MFATAYDYVTFASTGSSAPTGDGAYTVKQGQQITVRAYVYAVSQFGPQYNPTPSGKVELRYYESGTFGIPASGTFDLIPVSAGLAYADITFPVYKPFQTAVVPDPAGDYQLLGYYYGDDELFPEVSYPVGMTANGPLQPDQTAFVGVTFTASGSLAVTKQPADVAAGGTLDPVAVSALDASGAVDTTNAGAVTAQLSPGITGTGKLTGTLTATAAGGVATFSNLSIDKSGQYGLTFTDAAGDTATSNLFQVSTEHLAFAAAPTTAAAGKVIAPAVTVGAYDAAGNADPSATGSVTLAVASASRLGTSPGTLSGTATEPLVGGVATFSDLTVSADGTYVLNATDSDAAVTGARSGKFKVGTSDLTVEVTTKLASKVKGGSLAKGAMPGDRILYSVLVTPKKAVQTANVVLTLPSGFVPAGITAGGVFAGNTITWTANTRLYDFDLTVPDATTLAGLKQVATSADAAVTYTDGDTDEATATNVVKLAGADDHLKIFRQPPASVDATAPFPVTVERVDAHGKLVTDENAAGVQLSLNDVGGGTGATLVGTTTATFVGGVATFAAAAGPAVRGVGKFTLTATETTTATAAAVPADTRPFHVLGYKLKLAGHNRRPLTAATADVDLDTTLYRQTLAVVDARGRPVTSPADLPDVQPSAHAVTGSGTLTGGTAGLLRSPVGFLSDATADQDFSIPPAHGTTQANYPFAFTFTAAGAYKVTYAPVASADGTGVPAGLVQPLTIRYTAVDPSARVLTGGGSASANEKVKFQFTLVRLGTDPPGNVDNNLTPANASVGVLMRLTHSSANGGVSGTPSAPFDSVPAHLTRSDGTGVSYTYYQAAVSVSFEKPGLYTLQFDEAVTPGGQPFDPTNASVVTTTAPTVVVYRVLPDRLVVTQVAPDAVAAGQPFGLTVQLQGSDGNPLTDPSATGDEVLVARVSAASVRGQDVLAASVPVAFVGGVATFTPLAIPTSGIYRISVAAFDQLADGHLNPTTLSIRSNLIRVTAAG